jgi:hypothetical protein
LLLAALSGSAQNGAKKPERPATKKEPEVEEERILKNDNRLTGKLVNSAGTEGKSESDLAGEAPVA